MTAKEAKKLEKRFEKNAAKARSRDSLQALAKLTEVVDGTHRIVSDPPVLVPARELHATYGLEPELQEEIILTQFHEYRARLPLDRRQLLERFELVDWARKVVGVGSVGTRGFIALLQGADETDPLFLQIKEATASVLEGPAAQEPLPPGRGAGRPGPAPDAGEQRHLPRVDQGTRGGPLLLLASAARHEGLRSRRADAAWRR